MGIEFRDTMNYVILLLKNAVARFRNDDSIIDYLNLLDAQQTRVFFSINSLFSIYLDCSTNRLSLVSVDLLFTLTI